MRRTLLSAILLAVVLLDGCDTFRSLAGRPTSAEIEAKRAAIEAREASMDELHETHLVMLRTAEQELADSVASIDGLKGVPRYTAASVGVVTKPSKRLYIMVGMYGEPANAERVALTMSSRGYPAEIIGYKSGKKAVGVCGSDKIGELYESFGRLRNETFCPEGVWILVIE